MFWSNKNYQMIEGVVRGSGRKFSVRPMKWRCCLKAMVHRIPISRREPTRALLLNSWLQMHAASEALLDAEGQSSLVVITT